MLFSVGGGVVCTTGIGVVILVGIWRFCYCSLGYYSFLSLFFDVLVFGIRSGTTISLSINTDIAIIVTITALVIITIIIILIIIAFNYHYCYHYHRHRFHDYR